MIIKNIKFISNRIEVVLDSKSFFISKENYIANPLVIDDEISDEQIDYLLEYERVIESKTYLIKLLNKRALSEYEVYLKLKEREVNSEHIKLIIEDLKRIGLINDEFVCLITIENELIKRKGKKEIIRSLKEKRINSEIIERKISEIDEEEYLSNFNRTVQKYEKMYDKKSRKIKENLLKKKLEELGYESELINNVSVRENVDRELELAKTTLIKIIRNKKLDLAKSENINKIKSKLAMKGFSYDIINLALEGVKQDETY